MAAFVLDIAVETEDAPELSYPLDIAVETEATQAVAAVGIVQLDTATELESTVDVTPIDVVVLSVATELESVSYLIYPVTLDVAVETELTQPLAPPRKTYIPGIPTPLGMRVIAQRIGDGKFLHQELPVADLSITSTLSGPQAITGNLRPHMDDIADLGLTPWNTWLHVEDDHGFIRASAILVAPFGVEDDQRAIECAGVAAYPAGIPFEGAYSAYSVDPLEVVRMIWAHVQSFPLAKLGVQVSTNASQVRIGGYPPTTAGLSGPRADDDSDQTKPYSLNWWDNKDCGGEIDTLAQAVPFDYIERQAWNAGHTAVSHYVDLGWPRVGNKRTDLRFVQDENIIGAVPVAELDESYVTEIRILGAGEGTARVLGQSSRTSNQLRRVAVIDEKSVTSTARAKAIADAELLRRTNPRGIDTLLVDAYHENAPYGSYQAGDDIFVQAEVDWVGEVNMWHRIIEHTMTPDESAVALKLKPSDSFRYGASA